MDEDDEEDKKEENEGICNDTAGNNFPDDSDTSIGALKQRRLAEDRVQSGRSMWRAEN